MVHFFQLLLSGQYSLHLLLMEALLFPGNEGSQKDLEGIPAFCNLEFAGCSVIKDVTLQSSVYLLSS